SLVSTLPSFLHVVSLIKDLSRVSFNSLSNVAPIPLLIHSFPTRRSSDLIGQNSRVVLTHDIAQRDNLRIGRYDGGCRAGRCRGRSEEHTSELQSRFDLVCRLLLEKKNKATIQSKIQAAANTRTYHKQNIR